MVIVTIKPRERDTIIQSLNAGVVPRIGLQHIQVGRVQELREIVKDIERISNEGASIRFIIGKYGSGKSFFLNLSRIAALNKKCVVLHADITPDKRIHSSTGQARALYSELMHNMATKAKPTGGALPGIIERWISDIEYPMKQEGKTDTEINAYIHNKLTPLQDFVSGYDFAHVLYRYLEGYRSANDNLRSSALRWLYGEYGTKIEARKDLGVRTIIDDENIYDYLKLWAHFIKMTGYEGILVNLDEMGVLSHRLNSSQARNANYEMILRMFNDCTQGNVSNLGLLLAGTDQFLLDSKRGLMSYEALARRLSDNPFAVQGLKDHSGHVIYLENLTKEETSELLFKVRHVYCSGKSDDYLIPDEAIDKFLEHCSRTLGADYFQTPGDVVKQFIGFLAVLEQNPTEKWNILLNRVGTSTPSVTQKSEPDNEQEKAEEDSDLVNFKI